MSGDLEMPTAGIEPVEHQTAIISTEVWGQSHERHRRSVYLRPPQIEVGPLSPLVELLNDSSQRYRQQPRLRLLQTNRHFVRLSSQIDLPGNRQHGIHA